MIKQSSLFLSALCSYKYWHTHGVCMGTWSCGCIRQRLILGASVILCYLLEAFYSFKLYFCLMCMDFCLHVHLCTTCVLCPWRPEKGVISSETAIKRTVVSYHMGARNWPLVLCKISQRPWLDISHQLSTCFVFRQGLLEPGACSFSYIDCPESPRDLSSCPCRPSTDVIHVTPAIPSSFSWAWVFLPTQ